MATYTTSAAEKAGKKGIVETSNLKATTVGNLYDVLVRDASDEPIAVQNGAPVSVGEYTGEGLQERYATIAKAGDKIALVATPAIVKDATTTAGQAEDKFEIAAGVLARAYEIVEDDKFAVGDYQITEGTAAVGAYVVVDGNGAYKVVSTDPSATNGFVGKVHSIAEGLTSTLVRIRVLQNKTIA